MIDRSSTGSRGKILQLLRRGQQTVNDLAEALSLTDNAVRAHLAQLELDGLVEQKGTRPAFRKPESLYDLTPEADALFGKAYAPILGTLLAALEARIDERELDEHLREVAHRLAAPYLPSLRSQSFAQRSRRTLQILEELGGLAAIENRDGQTYVRGFGCPFSQVVGDHPKLCFLAQLLVSELLGKEVQEQCQREDRPKCCFVIK